MRVSLGPPPPTTPVFQGDLPSPLHASQRSASSAVLVVVRPCPVYASDVPRVRPPPPSRATAQAVMLLLCAGSFGEPAEACSCPPPDLQERILNAHAIFLGREGEPMTYDAGTCDGIQLAETIDVPFEVLKVWKGEVNDFVLVNTPADTCGLTFIGDDDLIVFTAFSECRGLTAHLCNGSRPATNAADLLELLDRYDEASNSFRDTARDGGPRSTPGDAGVVDEESPPPSGGSGCSHIATISSQDRSLRTDIGVGALAFALLIGWRRRSTMNSLRAQRSSPAV